MLLFIRSRLPTWMNMSTSWLTKSRGPRPMRRRSGFTFLFCSCWSEKYSQKIVWDHFVQEKFDSFIERQLLSPSLGTVNIKQSKFCLFLAPKLDHIDDVIKKDILIVLEKAPRPRPVRLDQKDRFVISYG